MKALSLVAILLLLAANLLALLLALHIVTLPPGLEATLLSPQANAAALPPVVTALLPYLLIASLALGLIALVATAAITRRPAPMPTPVAEAVRPAPPPVLANQVLANQVLANQAEGEIASFLGLLQSKGRLVDFLMDNINSYNDAQVGAAARVVHAGARSVLEEHFRIVPIRAEKEGARVEVPANYAADEYRLLGRISGEPPFIGALVHHGWRTDFVKLPTILRGAPDRLPAIAPAEVELK